MMNPPTNFFYSSPAPLKPQNLMDVNLQFHPNQRQHQPKSYNDGNLYQGNVIPQHLQGPQGGHSRGNNWAKGWQPTSPNKRKGNDERSQSGASNTRQFNHSQQLKETYQAQVNLNLYF